MKRPFEDPPKSKPDLLPAARVLYERAMDLDLDGKRQDAFWKYLDAIDANAGRLTAEFAYTFGMCVEALGVRDAAQKLLLRSIELGTAAEDATWSDQARAMIAEIKKDPPTESPLLPDGREIVPAKGDHSDRAKHLERLSRQFRQGLMVRFRIEPDVLKKELMAKARNQTLALSEFAYLLDLVDFPRTTTSPARAALLSGKFIDQPKSLSQKEKTEFLGYVKEALGFAFLGPRRFFSLDANG